MAETDATISTALRKRKLPYDQVAEYEFRQVISRLWSFVCMFIVMFGRICDMFGHLFVYILRF